MESVYSFLKEKINPNEYIVLGVSGGVDSMVLLSLVSEISNNVVCAHINHKLRIESDDEAAFVQDYCKRHDILFETTEFEYEEKFSEKIARDKRYAFYEEILTKYGSTLLLTAHHGDDLIETVLMRIVRGSTLKGYAGIELISKRDNYDIMRPLLFLNKEAIYNYAKENNIPYREDRTNIDDAYTRNRYRKNVLPFLKEENADVHLKFLNYSEELLDYHRYVDASVPDEINDLEHFKELDPFIQKEKLRKFLFNIYQDNIDKITSNHLNTLINLIKKGESNTSNDLPDGYVATIEYGTFKIEKAEETESYSFVLDKKQELPNGKIIEEVSDIDDNSNFVTYLDTTELELPLHIRTVHEGDRMSIKNMDGSKKISDIFTDEKIRLNERLSWPIVVDDKGQIIWLPGLKKSHFDGKKNGKYDIILKYY